MRGDALRFVGGDPLRRVVEGAALVGISLGLATAGGRAPQAIAAQSCLEEGDCTFRKPNVVFLLDSSSAMALPSGPDPLASRWQHARADLTALIDYDAGFFPENLHLALVRYGHDPDPGSEETPQPCDQSPTPLIDGVRIDVPWYTPGQADWYECNGQALKDALLAASPPPLEGSCPIQPWTRGGLALARAMVEAATIDHPSDLGIGMGQEQRYYVVMLITSGIHTASDGGLAQPTIDDPAQEAAVLWELGVPTWVVHYGEGAEAEASAAAISAASGGAPVHQAGDLDGLMQSLVGLINDIKDHVIAPNCAPGLPRIMLVLDASSSMLNIPIEGGETYADEPGLSTWDRVRFEIAGANADVDSLLDLVVGTASQNTIEDHVHVGLLTFGGTDEIRIPLPYAPCPEDNLRWAMAPESSCVPPLCADPYAGPPQVFTTVDLEHPNYPPTFAWPASSVLPRCDAADGTSACTGSGAFLHLGLALLGEVQFDYQLANVGIPGPSESRDDAPFWNVLITSAAYREYSTTSQVEAAVVALTDAGMETYVMPVGSGVEDPQFAAELDAVALAGGTMEAFAPEDWVALRQALAARLEDLPFDPCCGVADCSHWPEPCDVWPSSSCCSDPGPQWNPDDCGQDGYDDGGGLDDDLNDDDLDDDALDSDDLDADQDSDDLDADQDSDSGSAGLTDDSATESTESDADSDLDADDTVSDDGDTDVPSVDDNTTPNATSEPAGCGCSTSSESRPPSSLALLLLLGVSAPGRLKRRRLHASCLEP